MRIKSIITLIIIGYVLLLQGFVFATPPQTIPNNPQEGWRRIGLDGKAIYGIESQDDIIIGGVNASKSSEGGIWQANSQGDQKIYSAEFIRSLERDTAGGLYAASYGEGVLFSEGGTTDWQHYPDNGLTSKLLYDVLPATGDLIYAASATRGLFVKTSYDSSWRQGGNGCPKTLTDLALRGEELLLASWNNGAFVSSDNGSTCQALDSSSLPEKKIRAIHATSSGVILASVYNNGIYHWDAGQWNEASGIGKQTVYTFLNWPAHKTVLAGADNGVYISKNDGETWQKLGQLSAPVFSLHVSGDIVYAGTRNGIWSFASPTSTPIPTLTPIHSPTPTSQPTSTPSPTPTSTLTPTPTQTPGIAITMYSDPLRIIGENGLITYTIELTGTGDLSDIRISSPISENVELLNVSPGGVFLANGNIQWEIGDASLPFSLTTPITYTIDIATQSLSGVVFEDANNSGYYDDSERGIANITIVIRKLNDQQLLWSTTDEDGVYQFQILKPGIYQLGVFDPPAGYNLTTANDSTQIDIIDGNMTRVYIGYYPLTPTPAGQATLTPTPTSTPTLSTTIFYVNTNAVAHWTFDCQKYTSSSDTVMVWNNPFEVYLPLKFVR